MLTCDDYITPASLDEAFDAMAAHRRTLSHRRRLQPTLCRGRVRVALAMYIFRC